MSTKYPGGFITKSPVAPTTTAASGIWTLDQQQQAQKAGTWPSPPIFIEDLFSTYLYTGNGSTQTITNGIDLSTKGGLVWIKSRSNALSHSLIDTARGQNKILFSNLTDAQTTSDPATGLTSFDTTGFSLGPSYTNGTNSNGVTNVSWTFRKQPKFFDIVTYTGNGTSGRTIAHNLGSAPGFMIVKVTSTTDQWCIYHRSQGATKYGLFTTAAFDTYSGTWNNTEPTSTVFTVGNDAFVNASGRTYVAYLFAHDAGGFGLTGNDNVISCGSVTYDSTNGNTINLGYEAQFVILKSATAVTQWYMQDIMRGMASGPESGARLFPNLSSAEDASFVVGPTATGFNIKPGFFSNGNNVIYIAIRRGPMKTPTVGTSVFDPEIYTGDNSNTRVITTGFPPDMVWTGTRANGSRRVGDRLRGLFTNPGPVSTTSSLSDEQFDSYSLPLMSGWQTGNGTVRFENSTGVDYVLHAFRRAPGFFDTVCYTGTGTPTNFTHNLGVTPELMIVKRRDGSSIWAVYAAPLASAATKYLQLNETDGELTVSLLWNNTAPTSTVFTIGASSNINTVGSTNVAYLFATLADISKVGSYTGTGALLTVNCGFTSGSRFVLIKRTDSTGGWYFYDSARGITSGNDPYLLINSSTAEVTGTNYVDTDTTGFKVTAAAPAELNANGGNYIFLAIA
jgi:hypothetical protein